MDDHDDEESEVLEAINNVDGDRPMMNAEPSRELRGLMEAIRRQDEREKESRMLEATTESPDLLRWSTTKKRRFEGE